MTNDNKETRSYTEIAAENAKLIAEVQQLRGRPRC